MKWKILNKRYLWKYWSSVLEAWHNNCALQKKQNETLSAVSIATISVPVSFCQKTSEKRVLLGTDIVPILSSRPSLDWVGHMVVVLRQNWESQFTSTQHQRRNCCHGNSIKGVILFLLWCTFAVPSVKSTASIFSEILFSQIFSTF